MEKVRLGEKLDQDRGWRRRRREKSRGNKSEEGTGERGG